MADATSGTYTDLARIKNDDDTAHFGYSINQNDDQSNNAIRWSEEWQKELNNIDEKIGYNLNQKNDLMELKQFLIDVKNNSIDIKLLAHTDVEDSITFKLEYLFSRLGKLNDGYYESKDFVRELEGLLFTPEEIRKIGAVELKRTNQDKSVNIIQCIYTKHNEEPSYYLLAPNLPVQRFSAEDILSLAKKGYGIESKAIPGIMYFQKFIPGKKSEKISYRLYKNFKSSKTEIDEYAEQKARVR